VHSICLLTTTAALAAQTFAARFEAAPLLVPGQRVRVWALEPAPVLGRGGVREARVVGTLMAYHPPDSLIVLRTSVLRSLWGPRERTVYWADLKRMEVPNGRDPLLGVAAGIGAAVAVGLAYSAVNHMFCSPLENCGRSFLYHTGRAAVVTVPVGLVFGILTTRWKRVY